MSLLLFGLSPVLANEPVRYKSDAQPAPIEVEDAGIPGRSGDLPIPPNPRATGPLFVDIYADVSLSTSGQKKDDIALVQGLVAEFNPDDQVRITAFDGTLHPLAPATSPTDLDVPAAFEAANYTGLATFFSPVWMDVSAQQAAIGDRTHVVIVVTDGTSDPTNTRAKDRPDVDDPTWKNVPPAVLGNAKTMFVVRDAKPARGSKNAAAVQIYTEGAIPARWTEPSGKESTIVFWNPPAGWAPPWAELPAWVESLRPIVPAPVVVEESSIDWGAIGKGGAKVLGGLLLIAGVGVVLQQVLLTASRKAAHASATAAAGINKRNLKRALEAGISDQGILRIEPMGMDLAPEVRKTRPGDTFDVGPAVASPGVPIPLPGGGFTLTIGTRPDRATIQPRGTRSGIALMRGGYLLPVGREKPAEIADGDIVIDARSETPLVKVHLGAARAALGRTA